jgi:hypothetical protein
MPASRFGRDTGSPMNRRVLSDLFTIDDPGDLLCEVLGFCGLGDGRPEGVIVTAAYDMTRRLYQGRMEGYRGCDTAYHDFTHAAETFLTMARLLHGARLASEDISPGEIAVGLTAAILHDAGYIRKVGETAGTGARYRTTHEERGMAFVSDHGAAIGLKAREIDLCRSMIRGTMMTTDVNAMSFHTRTHELLVRMLSISDLLAQLSSATYLERLMHLYDEDHDTQEPHYRNLPDCYHKALSFDARARDRLRNHLDQSDTYLANHFAARWRRPVNLYRIAMDRQIRFLADVLTSDSFNPRCHLRRWGSLQALQQRMSTSPPSRG